jgi:hypothetical protein
MNRLIVIAFALFLSAGWGAAIMRFKAAGTETQQPPQQLLPADPTPEDGASMDPWGRSESGASWDPWGSPQG